ncbi:sterol desaturase/sphingolipid hydroxylase (fatty acid hydroxylase superfamily) [Rhabdobacter roseus]|uniref:Sterol desaturase/sphingolipid hydroxylase (Fatty acid hydroxylase superfamily) n=1 Tax=Rhabdobacter roseus TaxID=1655419 RepID=A0A840U0B7_9BACT|nr:sterol desaturase family protein [Rhabdobacter roseus]MBB5285828.1 sterol desaturase/sphingolipid hydroxylase (fatty acid hydroxylase superfamily) [Rhabdobacter roseus]
MEQEPLLLYATPVIVLAVLLEYFITRHDDHKKYDGPDFRASLGIGLGSLVINGLFKTLIVGASLFFYELVPWRLPTSGWVWVVAYLAIDFCNYLAHYLGHRVRLLWATHVTHHSSEHLNFSTAFRNSWTQHLKIVFFIPVWLMGIHPVIVFTCYQLDLLYQFWIHTEVIPKLPRWVEYVFVTPSHHRVHHGKNEQYIDKNFGTTFILWDRLFGTFQEEDERPVYGITKPLESQNVVYLNFHEWTDIWRDLRRARSLRQVLGILFGPP